MVGRLLSMKQSLLNRTFKNIIEPHSIWTYSYQNLPKTKTFVDFHVLPPAYSHTCDYRFHPDRLERTLQYPVSAIYWLSKLRLEGI